MSGNGQAGVGGSTIPVAPGRWPFLGHRPALFRRPLEFVLSLRSHGDIVIIYLGTTPVYVLTDSALAAHVLDEDQVAEGVIIDRHADTMIESAGAMADSWRPGQVIALDDQLRNLTLDIAAAITLAWLFHEIARHPQVERRLHAELDRIDGPVTGAALPRLTYTRQVVDEVLRLHPPLPLVQHARADLGSVRLPAGAKVAISPYALHRDPRFFPDPNRFDPDRWLPDRVATLPSHAYHPGPRHWFAQTGITVVAATIAARWRLVPVRGKPVHTKVNGLAYPSRLPMTVEPR